MATFNRFEEIEAWQVARSLTNRLYTYTLRKPFTDDFALRDQIRRSGISIGLNNAEGFGRNSNREFRNFLRYASGSSREIQSQLYTALDQQYIEISEFEDAYREAESATNLVGGLIQYLDRVR